MNLKEPIQLQKFVRNRSKMSSNDDDTNLNVCQVCHKSGAQRHFGGICCAPCKMFFRRNVQYNLENQQCQFGDSCDVTVNTRHICRICRFKKCLKIGMEKELLRASRLPSRTSQNPQLSDLSQTDSFQNDPLLLNVDEWNILSNIAHTYDDTSSKSNILELVNNQSTYPPKIRLKIGSEKFSNLLNLIYRSFGSFLERLPRFSTLQIGEKIELLHRHFRTIGGFHSVYLLRETNVHTDPLYQNTFSFHCGSDIFEENLRIVHQHNFDGTILKLFLVTQIFSTCTDIVQPRSSSSNNEIFMDKTSCSTNIKDLLEIQNDYIEILFKYMLYRYGSRDAVLHFAAIIKNFLDLIICLIKTGEHYQLQNELIEKIRSEIITNFISQNRSL
ncbi:hypothetical protein I4U23_021572 [Adineta vaga]|nr:hypothetical protein I4U23_021572 [Adineta vaga]